MTDKTKLLLYQRLASNMKICSRCDSLSFLEDEICSECESDQFYIDEQKLVEKAVKMYDEEE